jgi:hypothetical protein
LAVNSAFLNGIFEKNIKKCPNHKENPSITAQGNSCSAARLAMDDPRTNKNGLKAADGQGIGSGKTNSSKRTKIGRQTGHYYYGSARPGTEKATPKRPTENARTV